MVAEKGLQIDMGDCNMQCSNHPDQTNIAGGICAVCLQEKLGNLISSSSSTSSFPIAVFPSSSPSSSPSFRSEHGGSTTTATASVPPSDRHSYSKRTRIPFLPTKKKKKKDPLPLSAYSDQASFVFKRSKSVAAAAARRGLHFTAVDGDCPRRRGLWSFLYLSKHASNSKSHSFKSSSSTMGGSSSNGSFLQRSKEGEMAVVDENESPIQAAFERKVSRSRSVGCGSRSFSGDFFERISTGFGDCTLRRVESQREGKPKMNYAHRHRHGGGQDCAKQRVKCGGIFSGFTITSSSSSSSSSSYLVSSSSVEDNYVKGKPPSAAAAAGGHHLVNRRSKSWGWAFASPMRAFIQREASNKNTTPNLNATPSLLL